MTTRRYSHDRQAPGQTASTGRLRVLAAGMSLSTRAVLGYPYLLAACMPAFATVYLWRGARSREPLSWRLVPAPDHLDQP